MYIAADKRLSDLDLLDEMTVQGAQVNVLQYICIQLY